MISTEQLQTIGNEVAARFENKYPLLVIHFRASAANDKETFVEVLIGARDGNTEKVFQLGLIEHSTAPNAFRFQQVFERSVDNYVHQFLRIG